MRLSQPVLFVGLGGTGCLVGAELERRLREEICGPDGTEFQRRRPSAQLLPYQLPSCLQFVYSDVNQSDLDQLPRNVVPGQQHLQAALQTARYVRDLVPQVDTYPEVAASLRLSAGGVVDSWLPPPAGEPRVAPLQKGAGQLPTVGRAALFETFRNGVNPALRDLSAAIGKLSNSGEDLSYLNDTTAKATAVDVFVAFSVAGGTGAGIFYDYLHLLGRVFNSAALKAQIYPLVLMPSAFAEGLGGGRAAQLNAGRALLDLFRLVDEQNGGDVERTLSGTGGGERALAIDPDDIAVVYPQEGRIRMRPSTVQTGFLFSLPVGAQKDDLHRSMVSLVMSLVGSEPDQTGTQAGDSQHQSFADSFINAGIERQIPARNGIGSRGVSTALVASLTIPDDELADLVAGRMLRHAVEELRTPVNGSREANREYIEQFFAAAGLGEVFNRPGLAFTEPEPATGSRDVAAALADRADSIKASLGALDDQLRQKVPTLIGAFNPRDAIRVLLGQVDLFRVRRILFGDNRLDGELDKLGAVGLMEYRLHDPAPPSGMSSQPPTVPQLRNRFGVRRVKWSDPEPAGARDQQQHWYRWQANVAWSQHWKHSAPRWRSAVQQARDALTGLTEALEAHARLDPDRFAARADDLGRSRVGVSYLLPPGGGKLDQFYLRVRQCMIDERAARMDLPPNSNEADLVNRIIGVDGWTQAFQDTREFGYDQIVFRLRDRLKTEVKQFFRSARDGARPLIPPLRLRLAEAAAGGGQSLGDDDLQEFRGKLAGLVPGAFEPQGHGPLKVLVSYPSNSRSPQVEEYLRSMVHLPTGPQVFPEFRTTQAETIAVVLFRSSMGVTEVREVRDVLRTWASAQTRQQPQDHLRWRQRTGFDFGYLATRESHRIEILHRLLCAVWNGRVKPHGDPRSPTQISIVLGGGMKMVLPLTPLERASSWHSLLRAYELWTLDDGNGFRTDFCEQLMQEVPHGLAGQPAPPDELYVELRTLADLQPGLLEKVAGEIPATSRSRVQHAWMFWTKTFPTALDHQFTGTSFPVRESLRDLEAVVEWGARAERS